MGIRKILGIVGWVGVFAYLGLTCGDYGPTLPAPVQPPQPGPPVATTSSATGVTPNSATLTGAVKPNGASTTYYFEYGTTTAYGSQGPTQNAGSGYANVPVTAGLSGLLPNTTYHYRVVATNSNGTSTGQDRTFTTPSAPNQPPTVNLTCQNPAGADCTPGVLTGDSVKFIGNANDPDGSIVKCEFDLDGNGSYEYVETPGNAPDGTFDCMTTTTYSTPGNRTVRVRVTDNSGGTATDSVTVPVSTQQFTLTVNKQGTGSGTVTGTGINCGSDCSEPYGSGTVATLSASAAGGSVFAGWSGDCSGAGTTTQVTMNGNKSCTATFNLIPPTQFTLAVQIQGNGAGSVNINPPNVDCTNANTPCDNFYNSGTIVTLTQRATGQSIFISFSGDADCSDGSVTMNANKTCIATFNLIPPTQFTLTVTKQGTGTGTVTATGINCGSDCSEPYNSGTVVTLTATPDPGSVFVVWFGDCGGSNSPTQVTMNGNKTCTAQFDPPATFILTVQVQGTGTGSVTIYLDAIVNNTCNNANQPCTRMYSSGANITLIAQPGPNSVFAGWTGDCTGLATSITFTMDSDKTCTATFNLQVQQFTLTLLKAAGGNGTGTVVSNPFGINCGPSCQSQGASFNSGDTVTLTATPSAGSRFDGWGGDCQSAGPVAQVVMNSDKTCTALFNFNVPPTAVLACTNITNLGGILPAPPTCGGLNLDTYRFDGSGSSDPDGSIVKYEFDFTCDGTYDYTETTTNAPDGTFDGRTTHQYAVFQGNACLRVTDNSGLTATAQVGMDVKAVSVTVTPKTANVILNGQQPFAAAVANTTNQNVTWTVVEGASRGSVNGLGMYTAPGTLPSPNTATVRACS
ncbi:MAG: InlB B-repeat-containing protein, partial [bacterium]